VRVVPNELGLASEPVVKDVQKAEVHLVDMTDEGTGLAIVWPNPAKLEEVAVCFDEGKMVSKKREEKEGGKDEQSSGGIS
jgi:hypothetical protein